MTVSIYTPDESVGLLAGSIRVLKTWIRQGSLLRELTKRDVLVKYRGSVLGFSWAALNPLIMLAIYSFVFGFLFQMSWDPKGDKPGAFAVMLFCGLIPYTFFNEVLSRSTTLIVSQPSYVKKVAFPVEVFPCVVVGSALLHALIGTLILIVGGELILGISLWSALWVPIIWVPLVVVTLAFSLAASALGVFLRDLSHIIGIALHLLFFMTPIFYPVSRVPEKFQMIAKANPIAYTAVNIRRVLIHGLTPDWRGWCVCLCAGLLLLFITALWFHAIKPRFADVL